MNASNLSEMNEISESLNETYSTELNNNNNNNVQDAFLIFDDINRILDPFNLSVVVNNNTSITDFSAFDRTNNNDNNNNCSVYYFDNSSSSCSTNFGDVVRNQQYNYWALILILFPIFTLFGNVLVILSVYRERTLQSATNYFIVSLAVADLLVAVVVMPFAVYVLFNGTWALPPVVCDFYIAMDVTCSTSSIFNLVAISIDRYIAVTQPIKYAKHKNNRRIWLTIALVWMISAAIGSPIVLGLNNTPDRVPDACLFYNSDFIMYSSLSSFYIPCIIMVFLYYNIFRALKKRAMQSKLNRKPLPYEITPGSVIENVANRQKLAETTLGPSIIEAEATNTGSGSGDEEDEIAEADCHVISNDKSTEFILATVVEEAAISSVMASLVSPTPLADANGNNDSGYAPSQTDTSAVMESPKLPNKKSYRKNGSSSFDTDSKTIPAIAHADSTRSTGSKKEKKASAAARFTIYKVNKASRKKREKSSAKKERKATKTLAIVLGVFLICWVPFFTCNIMDAICTKLHLSCQPGVATFLLTTWLGYMNSFVNPIIYTIFNPEFRKAFKKLMHMGP